MNKINVKVYAPGFINHQKIGSDGMIELEQGATVADLYRELKVPLPLRLVLFCSVNYEQANGKTPLKDGDIISFLVPISGG